VKTLSLLSLRFESIAGKSMRHGHRVSSFLFLLSCPRISFAHARQLSIPSDAPGSLPRIGLDCKERRGDPPPHPTRSSLGRSRKAALIIADFECPLGVAHAEPVPLFLSAASFGSLTAEARSSLPHLNVPYNSNKTSPPPRPRRTNDVSSMASDPDRGMQTPCSHGSWDFMPFLNVSGVLGQSKNTSRLSRYLGISDSNNTNFGNLVRQRLECLLSSQIRKSFHPISPIRRRTDQLTAPWRNWAPFNL
jgi:hypothetical protein